jgi:hypothetical protein
MILLSLNKLNPINKSILINIKIFLKISENLSEKYNDQSKSYINTITIPII